MMKQKSQVIKKNIQLKQKDKKSFLVAYQQGQIDKAISVSEKLVTTQANDAFGWKSLASCHEIKGNNEKALELLTRAHELDGSDAITFSLLAKVNFKLGKTDEALKWAQESIRIDPELGQGHFILAQILAETSYGGNALEHIEKAQHLGYKRIPCLVVKGHLQSKARDFNGLKETLEELLKNDPKNPHILNDFGNYYKDLGLIKQATPYFKKALDIDPSFKMALRNRIILNHYDPEAKANDITQMIFSHAKKFEHIPEFKLHNIQKKKSEKIRIALVSPGLRLHPVGQMITSVIEKTSDFFDFIAYSSNDPSDIITSRIKKSVKDWIPARHLDEKQLAHKIKEDNIDIIIDMAGYGDGSRMEAMAMKPAPIIIKWVGGLINTMGLPQYDYLISDNIETPPGVDHYYSEKIIRMPDDYICYTAPEYVPQITILPAIRNQYITFGCFNNAAKINDFLLEQWALLMSEVPNSKLFLKSGQYESKDYTSKIQSKLASCGITPDRIIFQGQSKHKELLATYNEIDIALDTWPYSGGITTCEAFMMGVPVVTMPGPTFAGRHSATHLINAGMPELVVNSWEEYRQRVIELASDLPNLSVIRACLRQFLMQSPVCDAERFGKHFSTAINAIWQRHCEGNSAAALILDQQGNAFFESSDSVVEIFRSTPETITQSDFSWKLQGKIIAVDNGARLLGNPIIGEILNKEALELVIFDPASLEAKNPASTRAGIHYYANNSLGDGHSTTLKATLDPDMSSLLEPLAASTETDGRRVLARLPFNTVALDNIDGLPSLDWLVIDELSDSVTILEHGKKALKSSLLIQVNVAFQPTHERQTSLGEVQCWANNNGFRFYRLHDLKHRSLMPAGLIDDRQPSSELLSAQALLLPDHERMEALDHRQATKLSFLLHTVYGLQDAACSLLASPAEQQQYLDTVEEEAGSALMSADTQWQPMVQAMMLANRPIKPRSHGLPSDLVVSLTSYPGRFSTLWATLQSLLTQTVAPDRVILWIAQDDREKLPENVLSLVTSSGLEVHYCEDIRSYKKIVPTLEKWPEAYIATADDDIYYPPTWLEELVDATQPGKKEIAAHRIHKIRLSDQSEVLPYKEWEWNSSHALKADTLNFPTSGAGILYPPNCFHADVKDASIFTDICPDADDIWLYAMARLNGYSFKHTGRQGFMTWPDSQKQTLFEANFKGGNDLQLKQLSKRYGMKNIMDKTKDIAESNNSSQQKMSFASKAKPAKKSFDVQAYWNERYKHGGNSGAGSYGRLATFKAETINRIVDQYDITSLIEFGCGDGHQLSLFQNSFYYHGIDISEKSVSICREKFRSHSNKKFSTHEEFLKSPEQADATMSLDVIYHLIDDQLYHQYMQNLFLSSRKLCIIYAANIEEVTRDAHVRKRKFTDWIEKHASGWNLIEYIPNKYPMKPGSNPNETSFADFYIFRKNR
ncbi:O-linked N-acetylglucosamine transferase family protein [Larsenimonas rhizosphaerae]|uniref:protein O-GlcNAc transferase n=1 Tax=Larsenimonas rhizosphaerae TaxID=2944682 RepID=A0AA41ZEI6_9GAMM|nr:CDC27 family protein [Larsenimonas rhizosphaerae]MCX2523126.1 tetratricopeptide repeat protein [Larsenimonas rhizosphaerae]